MVAHPAGIRFWFSEKKRRARREKGGIAVAVFFQAFQGGPARRADRGGFTPPLFSALLFLAVLPGGSNGLTERDHGGTPQQTRSRQPSIPLFSIRLRWRTPIRKLSRKT